MAEIKYEIIRTSRKTLAIIIEPKGKVIVRAPLKCSISVIQSFVKEKELWIIEKLNKIEVNQEKIRKRNYLEGELFTLLGFKYPLNFEENEKNKIKARFEGDKFTISYSENQEIKRNLIVNLYRGIAKKVLQERTGYYSRIIGVSYNKITIKEQKTLWGSCSGKNNINYNWKIIMAPLGIVDYLVVHELCHIKYRDHSKSFWMEVEKYIPDYLVRRDWLKKNGRMLDIDYK